MIVIAFVLGVIIGSSALMIYLLYFYPKYNRILIQDPYSKNCIDNTIYISNAAATYRNSGMILDIDVCKAITNKVVKKQSYYNDNGLYDQMAELNARIKATQRMVEEHNNKVENISKNIMRPIPPTGGKLKAIYE